MHWIWLTSGLLLLMTVWVIGRFIAIRNAARSGIILHYKRLTLPPRCLQMLQTARKLPAHASAIEALHECAQPLLTSMRRLSRQLRSTPSLPEGEDGQPRIMGLAYSLCDDECYSTPSMLSALEDFDDFTPTPSETAALPSCVAVAQCHRLNAVLRVIYQEAREYTSARKLLRRLQRSKEPLALLERHPLPCSGLYSLHHMCLHSQDERLLAAIIAYLGSNDLTPDDLTQRFQERQLQLADELHRAMDCIAALEDLDWMSDCDAADALHPIFMQDPSGAYPGMTPLSRYRLRLQAEMFSRCAQQDLKELARHALALSQRAPGSTADSCICHWFMEPDGMQSLHASLRTRRGWLWARLSLRRDTLHYTALCVFALVTGLLFLQGRQPVFMLPFFAWTAGCISRNFLHALPAHQPLRMAVRPSAAAQTLVVLPAVLADAPAAAHMARRLNTLAQSFPQDVHLLLLGDFGPSITPASGTDQDVLQSVSAAIAGAGDSRLHYLQRARSWDSAQHRYCGRGGRCGAIFDLCRLISHGEFEAAFLYALDSPARLERAYAYVLVLPEGYRPLSGLTEELLSVISHPMYSRVPTPKGWRGVSIVTPDEQALSEGMMLLQPDVFMEAVADLVTPSPAALPLCGELAGTAFLPDADILRPVEPTSWQSIHDRAHRIWKLLPWQLTHVQTPSGLVANPLRYFSRFRLREQLRDTLVPLGRLGLLLWAVLTSDWPLFLLALAAPEFGRPFHHRADVLRMVSRLSLLPMTTSVNILGAFDAIFRKRPKEYDYPSLEVWVQGIAVTVFAAIGFALPGRSPGGLVLSALFAAFPIAHRHK